MTTQVDHIVLPYTNIKFVGEEAADRARECLRMSKEYDLDFADRLQYLNDYSDLDTVCYMGIDFAPLSFAFAIYTVKDGKEKVWFNGGLIFHGKHDNGGDGGAPTFSVTLTPHSGWSIHT